MSARTSRLRAEPPSANGLDDPTFDIETADAADAPVVVTSDDGPLELSTAAAAVTPAEASRRQQRFAEGLRSLKVGGGTLDLGERTLMVLGGIIAPIGLIAVLLGWWGASQTPYVFEQVPYLISGGLLGVGLIFLGAFLYFTHWLTELVKEHRQQSLAVVEALQRLQDEVTRLGAGEAVTRAATGGNGALAEDAVLVATAHGTMAHRADCVVVVGKADLRSVTLADGLQACKLCSSDLVPDVS